MKTSDSLIAIAPALAKAQGAMEGAKKQATNLAFKSSDGRGSKYANMEAVVDAVQGPLTSNGISYLQFPVTNDKDEVGIETMLLHESGEWIRSDPFFVPVTKQDAQGFGSAITYCRRYSLMAACGIAPEDDDGNAAASAKPNGTDTARQVTVEAMNALPKARQDLMRDYAASIMGLFNSKGDMAGYIAAQELDDEAELALWSLLPSLVRSTIKKQQAAAREQAAA